ncbi:MAG TPA: transglutaminase family protein [Verrucomicrobiae bacterium]|nr:transglutaminase family protein [Verrucomicrobiae bacterium]
MAIHVALYHQTRYSYEKAVAHAPHVVRLRPAPHCRTRILSYSQRISGGEHFLNWQQDPFANWNARLVFPEKLKELCVEVELVAEMAVYNPFDFFLESSASHFPFTYEPGLKKELMPFLEPSPLTPKVEGFVETCRHPGKAPVPNAVSSGPPQAESGDVRTIDFLVALNQRVQHEIKYVIRLEPGVQSSEDTLVKSSGSCRDSAWLLVQVLRHLGLAARFVSGYLVQLAPDVKSLDGPSGASADFTDLHAWAEVYLPGAGWIGLDPTSGLLAGEGHLPLSCTPEPGSAAPVTGATDPCESKLHHEMRISRIYESPRVTKPYTEEQWNGIAALGHTIDAELERQDVRLTMGGEPTFVSVDDPDGPEWNFTAVSHKKRVLSGELLRRLAARFSPGALLHYGQGKWYPGEPLPRWALAAYWRKDGVPLWNDPSLIADEAKDYGFGAKEARALALRIARVIGVHPRFLLPAYEDAFYYLWKERRLPSNVTPYNSKLKDEYERERIARLFQQGLGEVVGYALPLQRMTPASQPAWTSGPWFLRDGDILWLIPGDSPMGLRLPLDSIPWVSEADNPRIFPPDPTQKFVDLPAEFPYRSSPELAQRFVPSTGTPLPVGARPGQRRQQLAVGEAKTATPNLETASGRRPAPGQSAAWIVRTALCVEPREGRLHVFMPPVATTEDYLDLVAGIETAVAQLGLPVVIEGEPPPRDPRLNKLAVTPDPGVIEVNLHPSKSWDELVERTTVLYEEARQTRLGTEKFMLDGRHTGTGGGNHIIIGGATPADSPILRRPDLLRSLLAYWQNHPSLSWLFSSMFIGPTSQAPRIDEARHDSLFELEIAFEQLDGNLRRANSVAPWLADRLFRNLLIDASGNTHRAEFCIDKLYAPETSNGRLGLLEMRAFEMPPHARMSLAQHLLLRGLIARFWNEPYRNGLVRWGTDIHDRWMLPHFCETDLRDVLADLREAGFPFQLEWFRPHLEFRFPRIGEFVQREVQVELRTALEPWHVLGEQAGPGGTVRYVDSSLERLQVKARGLVGDRFQVIANGRCVPLHPTGTNGEGVAGVRYRAWQPPECLQPTIGVHTPITFDLYDTWNQRSLGGCTYHTAHPGGRHYDTFPINAYEAESRRLTRFFTQGATQGTFVPPDEPPNAEFPFTLDLRRT